MEIIQFHEKAGLLELSLLINTDISIHLNIRDVLICALYISLHHIVQNPTCICQHSFWILFPIEWTYLTAVHVFITSNMSHSLLCVLSYWFFCSSRFTNIIKSILPLLSHTVFGVSQLHTNVKIGCILVNNGFSHFLLNWTQFAQERIHFIHGSFRPILFLKQHFHHFFHLLWILRYCKVFSQCNLFIVVDSIKDLLTREEYHLTCCARFVISSGRPTQIAHWIPSESWHTPSTTW